VVLGQNGNILGAKHAAAAHEHAIALGPLIRQAREQGATTCRSIAAYLNAEGVPSREGASWHPASVARMMGRLHAGGSPVAQRGCNSGVQLRARSRQLVHAARAVSRRSYEDGLRTSHLRHCTHPRRSCIKSAIRMVAKVEKESETA
jgi:hypothetical protein